MQWNQIASDPRYKALSIQEQQRIRNDWFNEFVAPEVPESDLPEIRAMFDGMTGPKIGDQNPMPEGGWKEPTMVASESDRSIGEAITDTARGYGAGLTEGVAGLMEAPVNLLNAAVKYSPARMALEAVSPESGKAVQDALRVEQPGFVKGSTEFLREAAENQREKQSDSMHIDRERFDQIDGAWNTIKFLATHPGFAAAEMGGVVGQLVPGGVAGKSAGLIKGIGKTGEVATNIGTQGVSAGSQTANEIRQTLEQIPLDKMAQTDEFKRAQAELDLSPAETRKYLIDNAELNGFAVSTALNIITEALPGARYLEDAIAGLPAKEASKRSVNAVVGTLGEGTGEAITGGGEQVIQNVETYQPWEQGVGKAAAMEGFMGAGPGLVGGLMKPTRNPDYRPGEEPPKTPAEAGARAADAMLRDAQNAVSGPISQSALNAQAELSPDAESRLDELLAPLEPTVTNTPQEARNEQAPSGAIAETSVDGLGDRGESLSATNPATNPVGDAAQTAAPAVADYRPRLTELRRAGQQRTPEQQREYVSLLEEDRITTKVGGEPVLGVRNMAAYADAKADGTLPAYTLMTDADNFKSINDTYGHPFGDQVIRVIGETMRDAMAEVGALSFHRSGDEFFGASNDPVLLEQAAKKANEQLANTTIRLTLPDGRVVEKTGVQFSYGIGKDESAAEDQLHADKKARFEAGLRTERRKAERVPDAVDGSAPQGAVEGSTSQVQGRSDSTEAGLSDGRSNAGPNASSNQSANTAPSPSAPVRQGLKGLEEPVASAEGDVQGRGVSGPSQAAQSEGLSDGRSDSTQAGPGQYRREGSGPVGPSTVQQPQPSREGVAAQENAASRDSATVDQGGLNDQTSPLGQSRIGTDPAGIESSDRGSERTASDGLDDAPRSRQEVPFNQRNLRRLNAVPTERTRRLGQKLYGRADGPAIAEVERRQLPRDLLSAIEAFEQATNTEVVVTKGLPANGVTTREGELFVDVESEAPLLTTAAHEWLHQLRRDNPGLYNRLAAEVKRQGRLDAWKATIDARAERDGDTALSEDMSLEELTADAVGDALTDPDFLRQLAQRKPGTFARMAESFLRFLDRVISKYRDLGSSQYLTDVQAFREVLLDVLTEFDPQAAGQFESNRNIVGPVATSKKVAGTQEDRAAGDQTRREPRGAFSEPVLVDPTTLTFRESEQNNLDEVAAGWPDGDYFPVSTILEPDGSRTIIDGHNRTAVAIDRGHKIRVVDVTRAEYDHLLDLGFDAMDVAYAALERAGQGEASSALANQFIGANMHVSGMKALEALEDFSPNDPSAPEAPAQFESNGDPVFSRKRDPARQRGVVEDETQRTQNFREWSRGAPLISSAEAMTHDFKTGEPVVVDAFHGAKRPDRIGKGFDSRRATSGPMAYFTSNPDLASNYAVGKQDTSLSYEDQEWGAWFKVKPVGGRSMVPLDRAWWSLSPSERASIAELAPRVRTDENAEEIILGDKSETNGIGNYDWELRQARGNHLKALMESWLSSGQLYNDEERFMQVLELAGFPMDQVKYDSPNLEFPAVLPVHVRMSNPLVTNDLPASVIEALENAAKRDRSRTKKGADAWDKNTTTLRQWVNDLKSDSSEFVWTRIPDKVTEVFRSLGYDGIVDVGGKMGGQNHKVYVPFSEAQVKGRFNRGTYSDESPKDILFSRKVDQPFYSALLESVEQAKGAPKVGTQKQWREWLDGAQRRGEFKQSEREWIGIDEWLIGRGKTTREEIADFVRANEVQVQDVVLGEDPEVVLMKHGYHVEGTGQNSVLMDSDTNVEANMAAAPVEVLDALAAYAEGTKIGGTKFSSYRTPGGENYRELLLTLPTKQMQITRERAASIVGTPGVHVWATYRDEDGDTQKEGVFSADELREIPDDASFEADFSRDEGAKYRSSHWDQPNVLAHVRFDERTDADGKRVLFLQELQSDWGQEGRKKGFRGEQEAELAKLIEQRDALPEGAERNAVQTKINQLGSVDVGVPNMPFKGTDEWAMLAFKRMARWAVDNGFDRIAWTTGEQAAELFDLSKQIARVEVSRPRDGSFGIYAYRNAHDTVPAIQRRVETESEVADLLGKEFAEKVAKQPAGTVRNYAGLDLKVGGEGMRGFYDKILPSAVNKWAKKFGAKVGDARLPEFGKGRRGGNVVHAIDITQQMREAVGAGQPLFSRKRTPEQETALSKAGMPTDNRTTMRKLLDKIQEQWGNIKSLATNPYQRIFDRFHRMSAIEQDLGVTPEHSAYISARLSAGLPSIMEAIMVYGAPQWKDGVLALKDGTVGLLDALKPVADDIDGWLGWMVGRRAQALQRQGRENLMTDDDIKALLSLANGREKQFKEAALNYLEIKKAILDVAEQAGLIDPVSRQTWDSVEYIPFYRQSEDDRPIGPGTRKGLEGQNSGIRKLKGGEQNLSDPLGNIIQNFTKLIDASLKNNAMLLAVDTYGPNFFEKVGMDGGFESIPLSQIKKLLLDQGVPQQMIDQMPKAAFQGLQKMWAIKPPTDDDVVRVMRNGKPEYYRVPDADLLKALTSFRVPQKNWAVQPFIFAKRLLTAGVTASPEFMARNFIRDSGSSWVISDDKFRLGWDSAAGVIRPFIDDGDKKSTMMAGGSFIGGYIYGGDPQATAAALRRSLRAKGLSSKQIEDHIATVVSSPLMLWDKWQQVGSALENANRNAIYRNAIEAGRSPKEAAYMARDLMDFSMFGDSAFVQFMSDVLPFFNARLQGLYKLYRQGGKPAVRKAMLMRAGTITMGTLALLAWNLAAHGDGYDELEEWDRDTYWHIAPGSKYHIRIPKPFELGVLFATVPERVFMRVIGKDRTDQTVKSLLGQLWGTLAMNPIPQGALPVAEVWANKSAFTGRDIENMGDEQKLPEARESWYTSDTIKLISDMLGNAGNTAGLSPKRMEHLWNGYTGTMGAYLLDAVDWTVRLAKDAPERPEMKWSEYPLIKAIYRGDAVPRNTRFTTDFYDLLSKANQTSQTIKEYTLDGKLDRAAELEDQNRWLLGERVESSRAKAGFMHSNVKSLNKVRDRLSDIRKEIEGIVVMPGVTPAKKRTMIDELTREYGQLTKDASKALRAAQAQQ